MRLIAFDLDTPCQPWHSWVDRRGYARFSGKLAHRVIYARDVEPIPEGMTVDHACFNTVCVNPAHLRLLTLSENSSIRRPALSDTCRRGHLYEGNTYVNRGRRNCRPCARIIRNARNARLRALAA